MHMRSLLLAARVSTCTDSTSVMQLSVHHSAFFTALARQPDNIRLELIKRSVNAILAWHS